MPPAARIGDMHVCPMVNPGPVPHVGGPESSGSPDVIVGYMPQGRVGDTLVCVPAVDSIAMGSPTVLVNNRPAARLGDPTVHGGKLVAGCPTVIIGESGQGATLAAASAAGTPFCEECEKAKAALAKELEEPPPANEAPPDAVAAPPVKTPAEEALAEVYAKGEIAKPEIDALSDGVAAQVDGKVAKAPLKGAKRILEKALEYAEKRGSEIVEPEDIRKLKDIVRNTIVVAAGKEEQALALLREAAPSIPDSAVKIVKAAADPCGYSGMNIAVPSAAGMICEVQINSPHMIYAKEKPEDARRILGPETYEALAGRPGMPPGGRGHALYEDYRVLGVADPKKAEVAAESRAYYDAVRKAAGAG
jgi:uncharacterized Zn-binding protein involved in type VI secretion/histone H3/H4